jgi:hypothetical protein
VVDERTGPADRLVAFVTARFDEIEAAAKAAGGDRWVAVDLAFIDDSNGRQVLRDEYMAPGVQAHIALNNPGYVLADIAAKRRIVKEFGDAEKWLPANRDDDEPEYAYGHARALYDVIELLAAPFREHPDFDPAWTVSE